MLADAKKMRYNRKEVGVSNMWAADYTIHTFKAAGWDDKHIDGKKMVEGGRLAKFIASILGTRVGENPDRERC